MKGIGDQVFEGLLQGPAGGDMDDMANPLIALGQHFGDEGFGIFEAVVQVGEKASHVFGPGGVLFQLLQGARGCLAVKLPRRLGGFRIAAEA